jgi:hypothetical protein
VRTAARRSAALNGASSKLCGYSRFHSPCGICCSGGAGIFLNSSPVGDEFFSILSQQEQLRAQHEQLRERQERLRAHHDQLRNHM